LRNGVLCLGDVGKDSLAACLELQTDLGCADPAGGAAHQGRAKCRLHARNSSTYHRFGHAEALRRTTEAAALDDLHEASHVDEIDHVAFLFMQQ
jgi:hypothetical protein